MRRLNANDSILKLYLIYYNEKKTTSSCVRFIRNIFHALANWKADRTFRFDSVKKIVLVRSLFPQTINSTPETALRWYYEEEKNNFHALEYLIEW